MVHMKADLDKAEDLWIKLLSATQLEDENMTSGCSQLPFPWQLAGY